MKLRTRNESPVGGFYYDDPFTGRRIATDSSFTRLISSIVSLYESNGIAIPEDLEEIVEDQICMRQPPSKCFYGKGLGDKISQAVHVVAAKMDKTFGTKIEKKARGCSGCARRRNRLNAASR